MASHTCLIRRMDLEPSSFTDVLDLKWSTTLKGVARDAAL
jgi:hypothetical protein